MHRVPIKDFFLGEKEPLVLISGPCVIESAEHAFMCAERLKKIVEPLNIHFIFKASYDKANRSAIHGFRGPGITEGLKILQKIKEEFNLPILTDVHTNEEAQLAGEICDVIQIPAFLCRQTDLIAAAAKTKAAINVKKGQFMAPWDMGNVIEKITQSGNEKIILTERGFSFGYNNLVSDMRSIPMMKKFGYPVCFDASHSTQLPGGLGDSTGGQREYIPHLAKAAIAAGANALFIETHPNPNEAKSDKTTVFPLEEFSGLLKEILGIYEVINRV
jgi:2-dehydro-3-deoxyphosphooctonate aldolase (KDO 8-P synthase)